jgi:AcrR family transcriptional regulator
MASKREQRRNSLKEKLIDAASACIAESGLAGLRARDVAARTGCALGGIYTIFGDLDDLVLHVNAQTLERMELQLAEALGGKIVGDTLVTLAQEYARFARANRNLWDALFDHQVPEDTPTPDWLLARQSALLQFVIESIAAMQPELTESELDLRARAYFSAVHGIVSISLQGRFLGVPEELLETELERFVRILTSGDAG